MVDEYNRKNDTVYKCTYHIIFCPKYRRSILKDGIDIAFKELAYQFANKKDFDILEIEAMPDHVHMMVSLYPSYAPLEMVKQLKYYTANILKQEYPDIKKRVPGLWTRSCFISTVGDAPLDAVKQYIKNQKRKG